MKGILPKIASTVLVVLALTLLVAVLVTVPGCSPAGNETGNQTVILKLATTTSLYDTGLWDYLEDIFEESYNADLQITAVGTGNALNLGKTGDVDVVAVHDPAQEATFIAGNYSLNATVNNTSAARVTWAYNYFIIVGPESDPAGIGGGNATAAFQKIHDGGVANSTLVQFVSRGDNSGTHGKEKALWAAAGYNYTADILGNGTAQGWYFSTGQGMGATLTVANEKLAYTLTDKGTYLAYQSQLDLVPLVDTGGSLINIYSVMICKNGIQPEMAQNLVTFLRSPIIQALIAGFGVPEYGEPLFYPWDPDICGLP
ncbi:MAG: substrate-binding domain-containing protein [Dehalococcoidia bacterium]